MSLEVPRCPSPVHWTRRSSAIREAHEAPKARNSKTSRRIQFGCTAALVSAGTGISRTVFRTRHVRRQKGVAAPSPKMQVKPSSVYFLLVVSCLSLLGLTMPMPAYPTIRAQYQLSTAQTGFVSSCLSLGMLFAVSILPICSDSMGRRNVLMFSMFCTSFLFGFQVYALQHLTFWHFLAARWFTGLFAGCNPIFKAYLADVVPAERLPRFMVFREASATFAFIIGPLLGGYMIKEMGVKGPFLLTCLCHMVGFGLLLTQVEEAEKHSVTEEETDANNNQVEEQK
ncbi:Tetracycline resistance protein, partial [Durusdinium trenchii]